MVPAKYETLIVGAGLQCPYVKDKEMEVTVQAATHRDEYGYRTESVKIERKYVRAFNNLAVATNELGRVASQVACKDCVFATMTPLEVAEARTDAAMEQLLVNEAEERRRQLIAKMKGVLSVETENVMAVLDAARDAAQPQAQPPENPDPHNLFDGLLDLTKRLQEPESQT